MTTKMTTKIDKSILKSLRILSVINDKKLYKVLNHILRSFLKKSEKEINEQISKI